MGSMQTENPALFIANTPQSVANPKTAFQGSQRNFGKQGDDTDKVRLRLEKIQRDFLWGRGTLEKKPHLVGWLVVCLDKRKGVLGIRNLSLLSSALFCKRKAF